MHWPERIVLRSCRFIFPKYHKCVIPLRETCLRQYRTSFFALFGFTTLLARVIHLPSLAHAVTHCSRYLPIDLRVVTLDLTRVTNILYRTFLVIFWASVVQSYLSYIVPRHSTYEDTSLGLGLLAGFHFSRLLEQLTRLESRAVPCLYLPISIFFSDTWLFSEGILWRKSADRAGTFSCALAPDSFVRCVLDHTRLLWARSFRSWFYNPYSSFFLRFNICTMSRPSSFDRVAENLTGAAVTSSGESEEMRQYRKHTLTELFGQMMFVSGETAEPSADTTGMIEEIVRQQVIEMVMSLSLPLNYLAESDEIAHTMHRASRPPRSPFYLY